MFKIPLTWYEVGKTIGDINVAEMVITILCIVILYVLKVSYQSVQLYVPSFAKSYRTNLIKNVT